MNDPKMRPKMTIDFGTQVGTQVGTLGTQVKRCVPNRWHTSFGFGTHLFDLCANMCANVAPIYQLLNYFGTLSTQIFSKNILIKIYREKYEKYAFLRVKCTHAHARMCAKP